MIETHLALILLTSDFAPTFSATLMYSIHSPTSPLNFLSARSNIWNTLFTIA